MATILELPNLVKKMIQYLIGKVLLFQGTAILSNTSASLD